VPKQCSGKGRLILQKIKPALAAAAVCPFWRPCVPYPFKCPVDGTSATLAVQKNRCFLQVFRPVFRSFAGERFFVNHKIYLPMRPSAQTAAPIPATAVGQLANTACPTLETNTTKGLEVGRQPRPALHTPAHTGGKTALNEAIDPKKVTDFIAFVQALHPSFKIAFTAHAHLQGQFGGCGKKHFDLFFDLVQTFTLLNHRHRQTNIENVLATADADYLQAYGLWEQCRPKKAQPVYLPTLQRVLQFLQHRYANRSFTYLKIAAQLNYSTNYISKIFEQLIQQKHIEALPCTAKNETRFFKLTNKL
jgi:hypothetical protein